MYLKRGSKKLGSKNRHKKRISVPASASSDCSVSQPEDAMADDLEQVQIRYSGNSWLVTRQGLKGCRE